jgi:aspartate 1-decarboxylase
MLTVALKPQELSITGTVGIDTRLLWDSESAKEQAVLVMDLWEGRRETVWAQLNQPTFDNIKANGSEKEKASF